VLKLMGIALILAGGIGLGFEKSFQLTRRERNLGSLLTLVTLLKSEIRWGNNALSQAFLDISGRLSGELGTFAKQLSRELQRTDGASVEQVFSACAAKCLRGFCLSKEEWQLLDSLGSYLGGNDRELQLRRLEQYEAEVCRYREKLQAELPEKKKVCRSLGVFGSILLVVLVW
jgi:stage III sporulation protein AB